MATGTLSNGTTIFTPKTSTASTGTTGFSWANAFSMLATLGSSIVTTVITSRSNERVADKQLEAQQKAAETADLQAQIEAAKAGSGTPTSDAQGGGNLSTILIVLVVVAVLGIGGYLIIKKQ